ncbi:hypothetical protein [Pseudonocardia endophytica]|uniref:Pyridoxamine 5'-phosphate oxidase n=1 Tax=Pseudonocardia endophytica TaxID=401976 RepID=A0A4R1HMN4_PSEEN|nr:hypothetical protein [Pseudonocardia endophytica]TCK21825.1 hypothetical protein EV378_5817 [Pseudonocardia endophytica]
MTPHGSHEVLPAEVADQLEGRPGLDAREQAFPLLTADLEGFPHVALLSRTELDVTPDRQRVLAAVASRRTASNLLRTRRATLVTVGGTTAHYVKATLTGHRTDGEILGCELTPVAVLADSLGIPLDPISFRTSAQIAHVEHWDRTTALLTSLASTFGETR